MQLRENICVFLQTLCNFVRKCSIWSRLGEFWIRHKKVGYAVICCIPLMYFLDHYEELGFRVLECHVSFLIFVRLKTTMFRAPPWVFPSSRRTRRSSCARRPSRGRPSSYMALPGPSALPLFRLPGSECVAFPCFRFTPQLLELALLSVSGKGMLFPVSLSRHSSLKWRCCQCQERGCCLG
jgi:hypothetical protein